MSNIIVNSDKLLQNEILRKYSSFEISAKNAMDALHFNCIQDLMVATINAKLHLPHVNREIANQMVEKFLRLKDRKN